MDTSKEVFRNTLTELSYRYHIHHPFDKLLQSGRASKEMLRMWAANRYYYQDTIPRKDAMIISKCTDSSVRAIWCKHIVTHDVDNALGEWLCLTRALDLQDDEVKNGQFLLPATKFACDAYLNFCRDSSWQDGICSSMTHLFAGDIHNLRIENWPVQYPWLPESAFSYFKKRTQTLPEEIEATLALLSNHFCESHAMMQKALDIVRFKQNVLWCMMDALWHHFYATNCRIPTAPASQSEPSPVFRILGSGAGGGVPQWNRHDAWNDNSRHGCGASRSQCSAACSVDRENWILINCSPDFRFQWNDLVRQYPHARLKAVILTDNQLDHIGGLISLRESRDVIPLYCTKDVQDAIQSSPADMFSILNSYSSIRIVHLHPDESVLVEGITFTPYRMETRKSKYAALESSVISLGLHNILYSPCVSASCLTPKLVTILKKYKSVFFDGTFETSEEMSSVGGHASMNDTIDFISKNDLHAPIFIHVNSTNKCQNYATGYDGMEMDIDINSHN